MGPALAQTFPARPIKVVVPLGPGSPPDVSARIVTQKMAESIGQPFVVENRSGAGGTIGGLAAAKSAPDGYTLFMGSITSLAMNSV
jgi:tripartite-type tricarboxylate transporter receptor subunit TctC